MLLSNKSGPCQKSLQDKQARSQTQLRRKIGPRRKSSTRLIKSQMINIVERGVTN
jgi:hypothetical protein